MRVLFDAFWWHKGPVSNRHLMISMIQKWAAFYPEDELVVALRKRDRDTVDGLPSRVRRVESRLAPQGVSAMVELPVLARRVGADVIFTHNFTPLWYPSVVFLHDVLFVTNPEWFTAKERVYFSLMPLSARRAQAVVTSSESEAQRIRRTLPTRTRVTAVGLGLGERLSVQESRPAALASIDQFFLTVGRLNVRKNLAFTCQSAIRSGAISPSFPLVIAGSVHGRGEEWPEEVERAIAEGSIILPGYVSDGELAWLYGNCRAFLFFSRGEGFGLPPLEALLAGAEVVASDIPVMREILGDHATYVALDKDGDAEDKISRAAERPRSAADAARGKAWASSFTWERTLSALRSVVTGVVQDRYRR